MAAVAQRFGMQLGVPPWQHHCGALRRQWLIRQWRPVLHLATQMLQGFFELLKQRLEVRRGNLDAIEVEAETGFLMENHEVFDQLRLLGYLEP